MFTIDPREYRAALNQATGDLRRAEANFGKSRLDVTRYTPLAKEGAISQQELDNAINQARKELATRFDFKGVAAEILPEKDKITLIADDDAHLRGLREILIGKLSKRGVDLRNIQQDEPAISSVGHARQELKIRQGLEGNKAKEIIQAIKSQGFKVQSQLQDRQIRVTGKKKDELQTVIQFVRSRDFGVATSFKNFRD